MALLQSCCLFSRVCCCLVTIVSRSTLTFFLSLEKPWHRVEIAPARTFPSCAKCILLLSWYVAKAWIKKNYGVAPQISIPFRLPNFDSGFIRSLLKTAIHSESAANANDLFQIWSGLQWPHQWVGVLCRTTIWPPLRLLLNTQLIIPRRFSLPSFVLNLLSPKGPLLTRNLF